MPEQAPEAPPVHESHDHGHDHSEHVDLGVEHVCTASCNHGESMELADSMFDSVKLETSNDISVTSLESPPSHEHAHEGHVCSSHCSHGESMELSSDLFSSTESKSIDSSLSLSESPASSSSEQHNHYEATISSQETSSPEGFAEATAAESLEPRTVESVDAETVESIDDGASSNDENSSESSSPNEHATASSNVATVEKDANSPAEATDAGTGFEASDASSSAGGASVETATRQETENPVTATESEPSEEARPTETAEIESETAVETQANEAESQQSSPEEESPRPVEATETGHVKTEENNDESLVEAHTQTNETQPDEVLQFEELTSAPKIEETEAAFADSNHIEAEEDIAPVETVPNQTEQPQDKVIEPSPTEQIASDIPPIEMPNDEEIAALFAEAEALSSENNETILTEEQFEEPVETPLDTDNGIGEAAQKTEESFDIESILSEIAELHEEADTAVSDEALKTEIDLPATQEIEVEELVASDEVDRVTTELTDEAIAETTADNSSETEAQPNQIEQKISTLARTISKELSSTHEEETAAEAQVITMLEKYNLRVDQRQLDELIELIRGGNEQATLEYLVGLMKLKHVEYQQEFLRSTKKSLLQQIAQKQYRLIVALKRFLPRLFAISTS